MLTFQVRMTLVLLAVMNLTACENGFSAESQASLSDVATAERSHHRPSPTPTPTPTPAPTATPAPTPAPTPVASATPLPVSSGFAALPQVFLDASYVPSQGGTTVSVHVGGDIQQAIDNAQPGDSIVLDAGGTYNLAASLILRNKPCSKSVTSDCVIAIKSSELGSLPIPGHRVFPSDAVNMPKLVSTTVSAAIATEAGAQYYRLMGLEVTSQSNYIANNLQLSYGLIALGQNDSTQTSLSQVPHDIVVDRSYIHGHPLLHCKRGVALNSARSSVVDSYISEIHGVGQDTQAIAGFNGPGPFKIFNNHLEGAGENIMFGGADPMIANLVPSDIEIRQNHFYKPTSWWVQDPSYQPTAAGTNWSVKNLLETKNVMRMLIDGNVFENNWSDAQTGFAILFKAANQDGACPWCTSQDITFRNNIVKGSTQGINMAPNPGTSVAIDAKRIDVMNNQFIDFRQEFSGYSGNGLQIIQNMTDVNFKHNTVTNNGYSAISFDLAGMPMMQAINIRDNIFNFAQYGLHASGLGSGDLGFSQTVSGGLFDHNVFYVLSSISGYEGNFNAADQTSVGFAGFSSDNYSLLSSSPYVGVASDSTNPGADQSVINPLSASAIRGY